MRLREARKPAEEVIPDSQPTQIVRFPHESQAVGF
jgi:hypothetical protein